MSSGGSGVAPREKEAKALVKSSMVFDARNKLAVVAAEEDSGDSDRGVAVSRVRSIEPRLSPWSKFLDRANVGLVRSFVVRWLW